MLSFLAQLLPYIVISAVLFGGLALVFLKLMDKRP